MLIEFAGLPTTGKSSMIKALCKKLTRRGYLARDLHDAAEQGIKDCKQSRRFIRQSAERVHLFGALEFRRENPEIFDFLMGSPDMHGGRVQFAMEIVSQLQFAKEKIKENGLVFVDEGLLHRGMSVFVGNNDYAAFDAYNRLLPRNTVTVFADMTAHKVIRRSMDTRGRMPCRDWYDGMPQLRVLREKRRLLRRAIGIRKDRGLPVVEIDAQLPVEENVSLLLRDLPDLAGIRAPKTVLDDAPRHDIRVA